MANYTLKEKREYHANLSKVGAVNPNTGEPISDFERGKHLAKAQQYGNRVTSSAIRYYSKNGEHAKVAEIKQGRDEYRAAEKAKREEFKAQKASEKSGKRK